MNYTFTEKQNSTSYRDGTEIEAKDLSEAKKIAEHMQAFHGTVLEISDSEGVLAIKENGKWIDYNESM